MHFKIKFLLFNDFPLYSHSNTSFTTNKESIWFEYLQILFKLRSKAKWPSSMTPYSEIIEQINN